MNDKELREACKSCVTLKVTFKNPETGEENTFEETGSYFFGGVLTEKDGMSAYSGCLMGGAAAIEIAAMHRQMLKTMAEVTAKNPELAMIMMDDMLDDMLDEEPKKASSRSNVMDELLKAMAQRGGADDDEECQCPICRARRGESEEDFDDMLENLFKPKV